MNHQQDHSVHQSPESQPRTIKKGGGRKWIHAVKINGRWQKLRTVVAIVLLALLYLTPWITVGDRPFIRLSFLDTSFVLFGHHILIYEFYHFVFLALLLVLTLFLASAMIGRVWCGYACPQTIFIEHILGAIETLCEGSAIKRMADQNKPLTFSRAIRKIIKHFLYLVVSFSFAFTLVALFTGPQKIIYFESSSALITVSILTVIAWFDGAYLREQFCHMLCPYARFQSVMQDNRTITIGYDELRGEPRGRKKNQETGDCIDCGLCMRVCPSGIDIRQGPSQQECTACARCIDACDQVMGSLHRPLGLIRYDVIGRFTSAAASQGAKKLLRSRVTLYLVLWSLIFGIGVWQFIARSSMHVKILSVPGSPPYFVQDKTIKNLSTLKIGNQADSADRYIITIASDGFLIESPAHLGPIDPGKEATLPLLISAQADNHQTEVAVEVKSEKTGERRTVKKKFVRPAT